MPSTTVTITLSETDRTKHGLEGLPAALAAFLVDQYRVVAAVRVEGLPGPLALTPPGELGN